MLYYLNKFYFLVLSLLMFIIGHVFMFMKLNLFIEWNLLVVNSLSMNMLIYLDWMTSLFLFTVFLISSMIMFYCWEYMSHDLYNIFFFI